MYFFSPKSILRMTSLSIQITEQGQYIQAVVTHGRANLTLDTRHCRKWALTTTVCDNESQINAQHNLNIGKQFTNDRLCEMRPDGTFMFEAVWFGGMLGYMIHWDSERDVTLALPSNRVSKTLHFLVEQQRLRNPSVPADQTDVSGTALFWSNVRLKIYPKFGVQPLLFVLTNKWKCYKC